MSSRWCVNVCGGPRCDRSPRSTVAPVRDLAGQVVDARRSRRLRCHRRWPRRAPEQFRADVSVARNRKACQGPVADRAMWHRFRRRDRWWVWNSCWRPAAGLIGKSITQKVTFRWIRCRAGKNTHIGVVRGDGVVAEGHARLLCLARTNGNGAASFPVWFRGCWSRASRSFARGEPRTAVGQRARCRPESSGSGPAIQGFSRSGPSSGRRRGKIRYLHAGCCPPGPVL